MAEGKNIARFPVVDASAVTHVVAVSNPGATANEDAKLVPKAMLVGPQGPQGPAGPAGAQGIQGATGAKGDKGDKGDAGPQGNVGPQGPGGTGPAGAKGDKGDPGPSMIPNGYGIFDEAKVTAVETAAVDYNYLIVGSGDERVNKTVPPALNGDMSGHLIRFDAADGWFDFGPIVGIPGPAGVAGTNGADGAAGAQGIQGIQGPKGDPGDPGPAGAAGAQGPAGPQGLQGPKGDQGDVGPAGIGDPGPQGPAGPQGIQGPIGNTGATGPKGDKGDPGDQGLTQIVTKTGNTTGVLTDAEKYLRFTTAGAQTFTVPPNASVAYPIGTTIAGRKIGTGDLTLVAGAGVTLTKSATQTLVCAQFATFMLTKIATNEWDLIGAMNPV